MSVVVFVFVFVCGSCVFADCVWSGGKKRRRKGEIERGQTRYLYSNLDGLKHESEIVNGRCHVGLSIV